MNRLLELKKTKAVASAVSSDSDRLSDLSDSSYNSDLIDSFYYKIYENLNYKHLYINKIVINLVNIITRIIILKLN